MPEIPFPPGIVGLESVPKSVEYLINLMMVGDSIIRTPGIEQVATGTGNCRGSSEWRDGKTYMVSGTSLIRINSDYSVATLGTIAGSADCVFSQGQVNLVIIVKGGNGYTYNDTTGLVQITDVDFQASNSVDFIDGRHVFVPSDGGPPFYSEVDDPGNISPLAFFDAEELSDKNKIVINVNNQLMIQGVDSTESFRTNIDPDLVFTRREGGRVDYGHIGGLVRFAGTFAFLGRKREQGPRFYAMSSGNAQGFSTPAIDEILASYTSAQLEACYGQRFEWKGKEVIAFTFHDRTFAFSEGNWFYLDSDLNGKNTGQWRVKGISHSYGKYIVGDQNSPKIGILSDSTQEYGQDFEFEIRTFVRSLRDSNFNVNRIELDCLAGQSLTAETIGLSVSKDGKMFGDFSYKPLGTTGNYGQRVLWQPVGKFENFCGIRLRSTGNVKFTTESIQAS